MHDVKLKGSCKINLRLSHPICTTSGKGLASIADATVDDTDTSVG